MHTLSQAINLDFKTSLGDKNRPDAGIHGQHFLNFSPIFLSQKFWFVMPDKKTVPKSQMYKTSH
jgi:hypothetical protein